MGCRILIGKEAGTDREVACFFCSTSGVAFGPIFDSDYDPLAQAEAFLKWLEAHPCDRERNGRMEKTDDPRAYPINELMDLYAQFVKETGRVDS